MLINTSRIQSKENNGNNGPARATFQTKPLRGKTGCQKCRERRKKCDEQKPVCGDCKRLRHLCVWKRPSQTATSSQRRVQEDKTVRNLIISTYREHRNDMLLLPAVEAMVNRWIEEIDNKAAESSRRHKDRPSPVSDAGSSESESVTSSTGLPSPVPGEVAQYLISPSDLTAVGGGQRSVFEQLTPIWRNILYDHPTTEPQETVEDQHVLLSIVFFGWTEARKRMSLPGLWTALEHMYNVLDFSSRPQVERLALLNLFWRMMKLEASQKFKSGLYGEFLPRHFDIRPVNRYLPNPYAPVIKYFPWPGVRTQLGLRPRRYRQDGFVKNLLSALRFVFPSLEDAYTVVPETGRYRFSSAYLVARDNLSMWTVTNDFFSLFPELRADIPVFDPPPDESRGTSNAGVASRAGMVVGLNFEGTRYRFERAGYDRQEPWPQWDHALADEMDLDYSEFLVDF